jgi:hypothetical protein
MKTSPLDVDLPRPPNRTKRRVLALLVMTATAVVIVMVTSVLQTSVFVGDDLQRGQRFAKMTHPSMTRCTLVIRALYDQPEFGYDNAKTTRAARAFFRGCTGVSFGD